MDQGIVPSLGHVRKYVDFNAIRTTKIPGVYWN